MLKSSLIESCSGHQTKKPWTVVISLSLHVAAVSILLLIPLIYTAALPITELSTGNLVPPVPIKGKSVNLVPTPQPKILKIPQVNPTDLIAPTAIPRQIALVVDSTTTDDSFGSVPARGVVSALLQDALTNETTALPPPPPPPPPPLDPIPTRPGPVRIGGGLQQANLINQVRPVYPPLARQARIEGIVVLEAVIDREGAVDHLRVISGHPFLIQAAVDAVSRWQYRPMLLNGEPIEVVTTVTVTFRINQ